MNRLVLKILRSHLSWGQLVGFFMANLLGMCIVLLSWQFYVDVLPVFTQGDSFMKQSYMVIGKQVTAVQTLKGETPSFNPTEIAELESQPFVKKVGCFTPAQYDVYASIGSAEMGFSIGTDMFFESIPDEYVDADLSSWTYEPGNDCLPIIVPRNYLNLYNFGFAKTRGLPALSEGLIGMVGMQFRLRGPLGQRLVEGKIVAFSNRLNTILVPQSFMEATNAELSPEGTVQPSRLILEVKNPADEQIVPYLQSQNYEVEGGADDAGRMAFFLRLIVGLVSGVGLIICALSFYVLLLSVFLLLQKNTEKIDNLLLLGFKPCEVALPFHLLGLGLNFCVLLLSLLFVIRLRGYYLEEIAEVYHGIEVGSLLPTLGVGSCLFVFVSILNYWAIRRKVTKIWYIHRR